VDDGCYKMAQMVVVMMIYVVVSIVPSTLLADADADATTTCMVTLQGWIYIASHNNRVLGTIDTTT